MKKVITTLLVLLAIFAFNPLHAATYMDGYVVKNGDTLHCQIKTWSTLSGLAQLPIQEEIITKDAAGNEAKYLPTQIQGFGFRYGKEQMTFVPRVLNEGEAPMFMRVVLLGKKLNLYSFHVFTTVYNGKTSVESYATNYVIEDEQKRTVLYESRSMKNGKRMKAFFADDPELLKLYLYKRPNVYEVPDFVFFANKQK